VSTQLNCIMTNHTQTTVLDDCFEVLCINYHVYLLIFLLQSLPVVYSGVVEEDNVM